METASGKPLRWRFWLAKLLLALGALGVLFFCYFLFVAMESISHNIEFNRKFRESVGADYPFQYLGLTVLLLEASVAGLVIFGTIALVAYFWLRRLKRAQAADRPGAFYSITRTPG